MTEPMRRAAFGDPCVVCGKPSNHLSGDRALCCACHYAESGVAADWHPDCLAAMARAGKNPPPLATPPSDVFHATLRTSLGMIVIDPADIEDRWGFDEGAALQRIKAQYNAIRSAESHPLPET